MITNSVQEGAKLEAMQRIWQQNRRHASTLSVFEENADFEEFCPFPRQVGPNSYNKYLN